jgi:hypothetical protein
MIAAIRDRRRTVRPVLRSLGLVCASVLVVAACGKSGAAKANETHTADVYTAVLRQLAPPPGANGDPPVVYVAPFAEQKAISLETQAAVIANLTGDTDVRFVDELSEAVDDSADGSPAKGSEVVLLGPVPPGVPPVEVEAQTYRSDTDQTQFRFTVTTVPEGTWTAVPLESNAVAPTTTAA